MNVISKKKKNEIRYSTRGLSRSRDEALLLMKGSRRLSGERMVARSRTYGANGVYGEWKIHWRSEGSDEIVVIDFKQGGKVVFYPNLVDDCEGICQEMDECNDFRHYTIQGVHKEPRLHVLYSSRVTEATINDPNLPGYSYHSIKMQALPLSRLKHTSIVADRLAKRMLPHGQTEWNIGLDMLLYRDGEDGINWHADDTQAEDTVLCLVVQSDENPRAVCIQPSDDPKEGDQQVELFPGTGDAYMFDGKSMHSGTSSTIPF